jgi:hypothetical protein
MKKILLISVFACISIAANAGQVATAAEQQAMQDCLKTKTQAECNAANAAAKKTANEVKNKEAAAQ